MTYKVMQRARVGETLMATIELGGVACPASVWTRPADPTIWIGVDDAAAHRATHPQSHDCGRSLRPGIRHVESRDAWRPQDDVGRSNRECNGRWLGRHGSLIRWSTRRLLSGPRSQTTAPTGHQLLQRRVIRSQSMKGASGSADWPGILNKVSRHESRPAATSCR